MKKQQQNSIYLQKHFSDFKVAIGTSIVQGYKTTGEQTKDTHQHSKQVI